ncbi:hypothetical protein OS493_002839 [Desmophyllum pertusum]|uniref:Uncharacterized protein n=1 Tax=Desmophyllum pertusum TaxID=174260 RepID=A0A9W9YJG6_9CNID|nr:hypothetical protein OS493_002839 [Desmophyllum pertusum]
MSMRIPDRFLEAPSKAHGIDVEFYRRSFDQEDLYGGSPSQDSPVWSDPGSSRIPLRFISHTDPISPVLIGGVALYPSLRNLRKPRGLV